MGGGSDSFANEVSGAVKSFDCCKQTNDLSFLAPVLFAALMVHA